MCMLLKDVLLNVFPTCIYINVSYLRYCLLEHTTILLFYICWSDLLLIMLCHVARIHHDKILYCLLLSSSHFMYMTYDICCMYAKGITAIAYIQHPNRSLHLHNQNVYFILSLLNLKEEKILILFIVHEKLCAMLLPRGEHMEFY